MQNREVPTELFAQEKKSRGFSKAKKTGRLPVEPKTRTYLGRVGTGNHGGMEGPGGDGQHKTPTGRFAQEKQPLLPSRRWKNDLLGVSLEAPTKETLCKPMEEQNPRLTRGLSAVYHRGEKRSSFLDADQWTDAYLSL